MNKHLVLVSFIVAFLFAASSVFAQCPPQPLAGLWQITEEDDATVADHSYGGNDCTIDGPGVFEFLDDPDRGIVGSFDGSSWLSANAAVAELGNADFSYAAWVKTTQAGGVIVGKADMNNGWSSSEKKFYLAPNAGDDGSNTPGVVCMVGWGCDWITGGAASPAVNDGEWHHIVLTFERSLVGNNPGTIYVDGEVIADYMKQGFNGNADNAGDLVYIARSPQGDGVQNFSGLLDDVALFTTALTQEEVYAVMDGEFDQFMGEIVPTAPVIEGAPESDSITGGVGLTYIVQLEISGCPRPDVAVSPEGATISPQGMLTYDTSLVPEGETLFTVTVEATNEFEGGTTEQASWEVALEEAPPNPEGIAVAGALFVDLRAEDLVDAGDISTWENHAILDDFFAENTPIAEEIDSAAAVTFNSAGNSAYQAQEPAPNGLVGPDQTQTIEVWVHNENITEEETLVAWGRRGGPPGTNMSFNYGTHDDYGAVGHWGNRDLGWTGGVQLGDPGLDVTQQLPQAGRWHHLVHTYGGDLGNVTRVYCDGELVNAEGPMPAGHVNIHSGTPITIAAQLNNAGDIDFGGTKGILSIGQVRIHDGVLTSEEVFSNFEAERETYNVTEMAPEITGAPAEDMVYYGRTYTCTLEITGFPAPEVIIESPEGIGTSFSNGLFSFDTTFLDPDAESFTVAIEAENGIGEPASVSWVVTVEELPDLIALWQFDDDPVSTVATDSTDSGNDADLTGDAFFEDDAGADPNRSGVMSFAGNGWLETGRSVTELGDADFSYAAWVKTTQAGGVIVSKADMNNGWSRSEKKFYLAPNAGDGGSNKPGVVCMVGWGCDWITGGAASPAVNDGEWHHIVLTFERSLVGSSPGTIYVDGEVITNYMKQGFNGNPDNAGDLVYIARSPQGDGVQNFSGLLDDVALFTIVLTPEQVLDIMDGNYEEFIEGTTPEKDLFQRGDVNADASVNIADAVAVLSYLFSGGDTPSCLDTADANDDGSVNIADAVGILGYLFGGTGDLPAPFPDCGEDLTADGDPLDCLSFPPCEEGG